MLHCSFRDSYLEQVMIAITDELLLAASQDKNESRLSSKGMLPVFINKKSAGLCHFFVCMYW